MSIIRAFIPLKHPACARSRLQQALTARQRHSMYFALVRRIIDALHQIPVLQDVVIVTCSAEVEIFVGHVGGVRIVHQVRDTGINASLATAIAAFPDTTTSLIVPGDLPLVTGEALADLLATAGQQSRGVTIVPDRRHLGTNALVCTPADAIRPRFGPNSFAEHLRTAQAHGLEVRVFECGALALDIDEPEDIEAWRGNTGDQDGLPGSSMPRSPLASGEFPDP